MRQVTINPNLNPKIVIYLNDEVETVELSAKMMDTPQGRTDLRRLLEKLSQTDIVSIKEFDYNEKGSNMGIHLALGWMIRTILTEQEIQYNVK